MSKISLVFLKYFIRNWFRPGKEIWTKKTRLILDIVWPTYQCADVVPMLFAHFSVILKSYILTLQKYRTKENAIIFNFRSKPPWDLNMENYLLHENFEKRRLITKLRILTSYVMTMILWCLLLEQWNLYKH
jgi:hypothetical protein